MKKIYKDKILNIENTDVFDNTFLFEYFRTLTAPKDVEVIYLRDLLEKYKNTEIEKRVGEKPAMWSEVYSPKDELQIFTKLFDNALRDGQKIHIVGVTLGEEIKMLESYYESLGFMREDINAFDIDFSIPLVTVSCHIENLMWRGSDYKAMREKLFLNPPIRESGQNKALFKGITRGVIAGIDMNQSPVGAPLVGAQLYSNGAVGYPQGIPLQYQQFIGDCIRQEKILPIHMGKVLRYNLEDIGFEGEIGELRAKY